MCITGPPEFKLVYLDTSSKIKDLAESALVLPVNKISIQPRDNHIVALSGPNVFKIVRMQEGAFVYVNETIRKLNPFQNFTDHCWLEETKVALANDKCEIFIIQEGEVRYTLLNQYDLPKTLLLNQIQGEQTKTTIQFSAHCLCPFSKGLVVASDNGHFGIYIKNEESLSGNTANNNNNQ